MTTIVGISGSLRKGSFNTSLLRAAAELAPEDVTLTVETIRGVPLYDADEESANGVPKRVEELKDAVAAADGLLIVTPEYNNSMPGVFKNAVDWLSRPPSDIKRVFRDKPVAMIGASPGGFGTILSQEAWLPVLRTLGTKPWFGAKLYVSRAGNVFDEAGAITDESVRDQLRKFLADFVESLQS